MWVGELLEHLFIIKEVEDGSFTYVFGTEAEVSMSGNVNNLSDAQALANRWHWLVNNVTPDRLSALIFKL